MQMPGGERPHCARQFRVHGLLGERAQSAHHGGGLGRVRVGRRAMAEIAGEDVLGGELQEARGDLLDLAAKFPQMTGDRSERHARRVQLHGHRELLGARYQELVVPARDGFQHAEVHRLGDRLVVRGAAELEVQLVPGDPLGLFVRPGAVHLGDEPEHPPRPRPVSQASRSSLMLARV